MPSTRDSRDNRLNTAFFRAAPVVFLLLWSSGFVFLKIGLGYVDPLTFLALRYALVLMLLAPAALLLRTPFPATRAAFVHVAMVGVSSRLPISRRPMSPSGSACPPARRRS
jgi:drug/metabolite transporter (DMT)-like permease